MTKYIKVIWEDPAGVDLDEAVKTPVVDSMDLGRKRLRFNVVGPNCCQTLGTFLKLSLKDGFMTAIAPNHIAGRAIGKGLQCVEGNVFLTGLSSATCWRPSAC